MKNINLINIIDFTKVLDELLSQVREITSSDGGIIYLRNGDNLEFSVLQNDSLSNDSIKEIKLKKLSLKDHQYIAVESFIFSKTINIDNIYKESILNVNEIKLLDKKYGYKTYSIVTVPILDLYENKPIGILQIINKMKNKEIISYTNSDLKLIKLASSLIYFTIINMKNYENSLKNIDKIINSEINNNEVNKINSFQDRVEYASNILTNITTQLRGPLSELTINNMYLTSGLNGINYDEVTVDNDSTIQFISSIINKFELVYNEKNEKNEKNFNIFDSFEIVYDFIKFHVKNNNIKFIVDLDKEINIIGDKQFFIQIIIQIIQNSFNIFKIKKTINPYIKISLKKTNHKVILTIIDNTGGLDNEILALFKLKEVEKIIFKTMSLDIIGLAIKNNFNGDLVLNNTKSGLKIKITIKNYDMKEYYNEI